MKKHYLVLVHTDPDLMGRIVDRLDDGESTFWIHLDAKADDADWQDLYRRPAVRTVEPRVSCLWGTWSLVQATLSTMHAALTSADPGYLVLFSGQTYPIRSRAEINDYLERHSGRIHMECLPLQELWPDNYRHRLDYFCVPLSSRPGDITLLRPRQKMSARELFGWTRRLVRTKGLASAVEILRTIGSPRPDVADRVVGGSQWWGMPWEVGQALLRHHAQCPEYAEFLRWAQYPDESFFQTLVATAPDDLRSQLAPSLTHVDWTEGDWDLPRVLNASDAPALQGLPEHILFARKVSTASSGDLMDLLDHADPTNVR